MQANRRCARRTLRQPSLNDRKKLPGAVFDVACDGPKGGASKNVGEAVSAVPMAAPQKQAKNGRSRARLYVL